MSSRASSGLNFQLFFEIYCGVHHIGASFFGQRKVTDIPKKPEK